MFLELRHVRNDRDEKARALEERDRIIAEKDAALAERESSLAEKESELTRKDCIIRDKNKALAKRDKRISDLEERLEESREGRYGRRRANAKRSGAGAEGPKDGGPERPDDNPGGTDRQRDEDEYDGGTPQTLVAEDDTWDGKCSSSTGLTFNPENRPEEYRVMGLRGLSRLEEMKALFRNTDHKFDRSRHPEGAIIKDGSYPIDNNLAERQASPFTAMRKVIQHYGSDEGAEMAVVYLSVVSMVKLAGLSVWRFLGDFFEEVVTRGREHLERLKLSPA